MLSIVVGTHNEGKLAEELWSQLGEFAHGRDDCEFVIVDDFSTEPYTKAYVEYITAIREKYIRVYRHALNGDYAAHKNFMIDCCQGEWILNLDADEKISDDLLKAIPDIINMNPEIDLYAFPRVNTVAGLTLSHVQTWGWPIRGFPDLVAEGSPDSVDRTLLAAFDLIVNETPTSIIYQQPVIAWPDYQGRLFRNAPHIRWTGHVHERIGGVPAQRIAVLPPQVEYALWHPKTIARQERQNAYYDQLLRT